MPLWGGAPAQKAPAGRFWAAALALSSRSISPHLLYPFRSPTRFPTHEMRNLLSYHSGVVQFFIFIQLSHRSHESTSFRLRWCCHTVLQPQIAQSLLRNKHILSTTHAQQQRLAPSRSCQSSNRGRRFQLRLPSRWIQEQPVLSSLSRS